MANTPSDRISIFVSYAHKDLESTGVIATSRLEELLSDLKYRLGVDTATSKLHLLQDREGVLRVTDDIEERIRDSIETADMGLVFLSKHYCESKSCEKELRLLIEQGKKVALIELDEAYDKIDTHRLVQFRNELSKLLSFRFWSESSGIMKMFGTPTPSSAGAESKKDYVEALQKLAEDLTGVLGEMQAERKTLDASRTSRGVPDRSEPEGMTDVVIAAPTSDMLAVTDRLERSYLDAGISVVRIDRLGVELEPELLRTLLKQAHIFVQILGPLPGRRMVVFDNLPSSTAQYRFAKQAGAEILAWQAHGFDPEEGDPEYAAFLAGIEKHQANIDEFEDFSKAHVNEHRTLAASREIKTARQEEFGANTPLISIDADLSDAGLRDRIKTVLDRHAAVTCVPYNVDEPALAQAVRENDAIVLVYGDHAAGRKRANSHFSILTKQQRVVWNEKSQRFEIAVGDASPPETSPCPSGRNVHVIRIEDDIDRLSMQSFLSTLGVEVDQSPQ